MIYDITQPVFECQVYPGDPKPERKIICSMEEGDLYNLTALSMCAHNATTPIFDILSRPLSVVKRKVLR